MIKIENLHKSFGKLEVLKGIDLEVKKGEIVVINTSQMLELFGKTRGRKNNNRRYYR